MTFDPPTAPKIKKTKKIALIWTRFWTDAPFNDDHFQETGTTTASYIEVASFVPRSFEGPGYEAKSQGAGLEATCIKACRSRDDHFLWKSGEGCDQLHLLRKELQYRREESDGTIPSRSSYVETRDKSE